ncbi:MAG: TolC family protein [Gammaproteobacteria bacterium]
MKRHRFAWLLLACAGAAGAAGDFLPPAPVALDAIDALPAVRAAKLRAQEAGARGEALAKGPYGVELSVLPMVRHEDRGTAYGEWEAQVLRRFRLPRKAALDRRIGEIGREAATLGVADARHAGARRLLELWFEWLRSAGAAAIAAQQLEVARAEDAAVAKRVAAGDLALLDAERSRAALAQAEGALARAQAQGERARVALETQFPSLILPAALPEVPEPAAAGDCAEDEIVEAILRESHEVGIAESMARRQGLAAERAEADRHPDPGVGLRVLDEGRGSEQAVGLVLNIPFAGAGARPAARAERDLAAALAADAAGVRDAVRSEARQLAAGIARLLSAWQAAQRARLAGEAALARTERAWTLGEAGYADVALARRTTQDARAQEWQARLDVHAARLQVEVDSHRLWARHDDHPH